MLKWYWSHARRFVRFWEDDWDGNRFWFYRLSLFWSFLVTLVGFCLSLVACVYLLALGYALAGR